MSGWCPSSSACGMAVVCAAAVPPSAVGWLMPYSSHRSTHQCCSRVVHCSIAGCVVCDVVSVCPCCSCGGVSSVCSPLTVVVGCRCGGGAGAAALTLPSACWRPLPFAEVAVSNGGSGVCCDAPSSCWVWHLVLCQLPFALSYPSPCLLSQHCWFRVVSL